jgi:hypothetical protein
MTRSPDIVVPFEGDDVVDDYMMGPQNVLPGDLGDAKGYGYADDVLLMPNQAGSQWDPLTHRYARRVTRRGSSPRIRQSRTGLRHYG